MKHKSIILFLLLATSFRLQAEIPPAGSQKTLMSAGISIGYNNGFGVNAEYKLSNFAQGFPFSIRFSGGMLFANPGSAPDARSIFINNATNGTPEKKGTSIEARMDFLYDIPQFKYIDAYAGVHFRSFKGNFNYVGGNENFDITGNFWGLAVGADGIFPINSKLNFIVTAGTGWYFPSVLSGHDTSYSPSGEDINPRNDYTYNDADEALKQPKLELRATAGLSLRI
jgi:hypothetical protein